jgi:membrane-associated phospholipid phosphatase
MELILALRSIASPLLDKVLFYVTQLGSTKFYLVAVPVIYWCLNRKAGYFIGMSVLAGGVATDVAKGMIGALRPFQVDTSIQVSEQFLESATGSGMPSGHAFNSMAFWAAASFRLRKAWFWAFSAALVILIGFTRVYSGVHFPLQVAWGWAGGAATAVLVALVLSMAAKFCKGGLRDLGLIIAALVLLAYSLIPSIAESGEDFVGLLGIIGGMSLGYYFHDKYVRTQAGGTILLQAAKLIIGFAGFIGLKTFADMGAEAYPVALLPLYFLLGIWPTAGATAIFRLLRLEKPIKV